MDWHEKWASAEKPWDRLCDHLNGRGVPSLEDALIDLELQPVHHALRALFDQDSVRILTDMAEHPRTTAATRTVSVAIDRKANRARSELFNVTWGRCEAFMRVGQTAFRTRSGVHKQMTMPGLLGPAFRERLAAAMRIPVVEALSPQPWTAAARRVLPSPSPQMTATAMWAPVIAWCAIETLAESIGAENAERVALELFDQLRLRKPLAEAFAALGFEGEPAWRAAARIKVVLMAQFEASKSQAASISTQQVSSEPEEKLGSRAELTSTRESVPGHKPAPTRDAVPAAVVGGIPRVLWFDPDVRWLTGVHEADEYSYLVQEPFEELLWWLQMPCLLQLAGQASTSKSDVQSVANQIAKFLAEAEKAGYRLQILLGSPEEEKAVEASVQPRADEAEPVGTTEKTARENEPAKQAS